MANRLTYQIGFTADTSQIRAALQETHRLLNNISTYNGGENFSVDMREAAQAAAELQMHLNNAFNANTGKLDLSKFQQSLKTSGVTLEQYATRLQAIGPDGERAFLGVASAISKAELPLRRTNALMDKLWITMQNTLRWQLTSSVLHGFIGAVQTAVGYTQDLDSSLNNIRIVTNKSAEDMAKFAKQANNAAKVLSATTTDYTDASLIYYQQGLSDKEVEGRTETTIKMANVTGDTAEEVSEQLTAVWNNFYDGSKSLEYYADVMVALGAATASSSDEIAEGVQQFAAVAGTVGLSYEYATTALATLTAETRQSANVVGTALRTLFTRIQGLTQDETQEDGTNLNKYSQALANVGVAIKDAQGNLRAMDDVLKDTAMAWETLNNAQQVALAQTVGGVRQYTTFVNLMENWDKFEANLGIATMSEGALQEQQEIYAESWEAARDRVRAAAEDIYDSIFDPDLFIGLDDVFTPLLNGVADVVDGMGGLKGIVLTTGTLMMNIYGDKMANGLRNIAYEFGRIIGVQNELDTRLKRQAAQLAVITSGDSSTRNQPDVLGASFQKRDVDLQIQLNEKARELTEEQYKQLDAQREYLANLGETIVQYARLVEQSRNAADSNAERIILNEDRYSDSSAAGIDYSATIASLSSIRNVISTIDDEYVEILGSNTQGIADLNKITTLFQGLNQRVGGLRALRTQMNALHDATGDSANSVEDLRAEYQRLSNIYKDLTGNPLATLADAADINTVTQAVNQAGTTITRRLNQVQQAAANVGNELVYSYGDGSRVARREVDNLATSSQELGDREVRLQNINSSLGLSYEQLKQKIANTSKQIKDWADQIVAAGQTLMSLVTIINGVKQLGSIWSDDDLTTGEKVIQTLSAVSTILMGVVPLLNLYSKSMTGAAAAQIANAVASATNTAGIITFTGAIKVAGVAVKSFTKALLSSPLFYLVIIAAAIGALVAIIDAVVVTAEEARENIQKATEAYEEQKQILDDLNDSLETTKDRIEELNSQDTLTIIEQEELDKLAQEQAYLEQQIELQKELTKATQAAQAKEIGTNFATATPDVTWGDFLLDGNQVSADHWFRTNTKDLDEDSQEYQEYLKRYEEWKSNQQAVTLAEGALKDWLGENAEAIQQTEESYKYYIDAINNGTMELDPAALSANQKELREMRIGMFMTEAEYQEFFLKPVLDTQAVEEIGVDLYKVLSDGDIDSASGLISSAMKNQLMIAGISIDEFLNYVNDRVDNTKAAIEEKFNGEFDFEGLTKEDWEILMDINLKNFEDAQELQDFLDNYRENNIGVVIDIDQLKEDISKLYNIVRDIDFGDTITEEDYQTLISYNHALAEYFTLQADGSHKALVDQKTLHEETIKAFEEELAIMRKRTNINDRFEENTNWKLRSYDDNGEVIKKEDFDWGRWASEGSEYADIEKTRANILASKETLHMLEEIGYTSKAISNMTTEEILTMAQDIADLDLSAIGAGQLEEMLASAAENALELDEMLREGTISAEAYGKAYLAIENSDNLDGLDTEEVAEYGDYLAEVNEGLDKYKGMADKAAAITMRMNRGVEDLAENFEEWEDILNKSEKTSHEYYEAMSGMIEAVSDITNVSTDYIDNDFIVKYLDDIRAAADGDAEAIDRLKAVLSSEIIAKITLDNGLDERAIAEVQTLWTEIESIIPDNLDVGMELTGTDNFVTKLNELILAAGMTQAQVNEMLGSMGFEAKFASEPQKIQSYQTVTTTRHTVTDKKWDPETETWSYIEKEEAVSHQEPINEEITAFAMSTAPLGEVVEVPKIESLIKMPTGGSNNYSNYNPGGNTPSGGGGSSEPKKLDKAEDKTWEDIEDRYHEINRELEDQASILDDIGNNIDRAYGTKKLALYEKQIKELNKQQDMYNAKLKIAENYLASDTTEIKDLLGLTDADFNEFGEIQDYDSILTSILDEYNAENTLYNEFIDRYNAANTAATQETMEAELEAWKIRIEEAEVNYEAKLAALAQYENTLNEIREARDNLEETARQIEDAKLDKIEHRLETVIDIKEMRDAVRDLTRDIAESFGDALTHGVEVARLDWESAQANMNMLSEYTQTFSEYQDALANATEATDIDRIRGNLKDLQSQAIDTANALLEWIESIETMLPDAIDAASERFALFIDQLEHNESVLDTIKELYALQGVTYKTNEGFAQLQRVSQEKMEAQLAQAQLHREWYEGARQALLDAEAALAGVSEDDAAYDTLKNNRDALLAEYNEAQEAMLSSAQAAMETAQQMYTDALEKTVYDFGQIVSNGQGLDLLQEKYDHYIETEERYLDKVNEAYQVASWYNKLQADIDDTTNSVMKNRLQALQEEINSRREGNKLSQYDLDILEAKYNVLQAQIALEDAQNAKNELRLVRDSQGNWNYQYTADQSGIDDAQQNLLNAENEYYNIAKQQTEDVTGMIISAWQECEEKIKEIYSDMTLTDEERTAKAEELYAYYTEKIKYLEEEKQIAIQDMTAAGNEALFDMAVVLGDEITDLTGITSEDIQNIVAESGMNIIELLSADNETIKEIVGSNTELIDLFENTYAEDLSKMTANTTEFETELQKTLLKCEEDFIKYRDTITNVAEKAGVDLNNLAAMTDKVSQATDIAREAGLNAADALWEELYAVQDLSEGYAALAESVYEYIDALRDLAAQLATTAASESGVGDSGANAAMGTGYDVGTDYSAMISQGIANGWIAYGDDKYNTLFRQREAKIDGEGYKEEYFGTRGDEADAGFAAINPGDTIGGYAEGQYDTEEEWRKQWDKVSQFATGGYTGDFNDSKLAFLHEKELVLNQEDTRNILSAVAAVRTIGPEIFSAIERALDGNSIAALAMMASRLSGAETVSSTHDTIEQHVTIEHVEFPNVTSSDEIQDAFASIVNDASQWARRRKS